MSSFTYTLNSRTVFYKGYVFDSLLELKFVLTMEDTHAWLRDGLEIYYGINVQSCGIKTNLHCYRPDLLIRELKSGQAELIEIKPDGFNPDRLYKRRRIVEKFTGRFAYDWAYRVVTESQINLSQEKLLKYKKILAAQNGWAHKPCIKLLQNNTSFSDTEYDKFVRTGLFPAIVLL